MLFCTSYHFHNRAVMLCEFQKHRTALRLLTVAFSMKNQKHILHQMMTDLLWTGTIF